ncbi:MAG: GspH/FimT family protein [Candidatus Aminicenantes bacterium]|nr:GspH/FimT family protein [Candidatus Aminicenantes bacterium]
MGKGQLSSVKKSEGGFSLMETVIALLVVALIVVVASTSFLSYAPKYRLLSAVRKVHSRLNYARYKAIFEGKKVRLKFESNGYTVEKYDEDRKEWKRETRSILEGVTIQANNNPVFHPQGTVSNLASIIISNSWGKYRVTLAISGRIKVTQL